MTKIIEVGLITPPLGLNVYIVKGASPVPIKMEEVFSGVSWFLFMDIFTLAILIAFPQITLWLPNLVG
jgi:TRAP-type C4-dicarboxylate transport system permease large subunit